MGATTLCENCSGFGCIECGGNGVLPVAAVESSGQEILCREEPCTEDDLLSRRMTVLVEANLIAAVLNGLQHGAAVRLPIMPGLPEDVRVESVWFDWERRCWSIGVVHPSFDRVPPGAIAPVVEPFVWVTLLRREDGVLQLAGAEAFGVSASE